jgi:tetratricopeptide (TPR) repeat protein
MMKKLIIFLGLLLLTPTFSLAQSPLGHVLKGNEYKAKGDRLRAEGQYLLALEQNPELAEAHASLGEIYLDRKSHQKAIDRFEKALSLDYKTPVLFMRLAFAYRSRGDLDSAIRVYKAFIENYPVIPEAHLGLGGLYDAKGMKTEAEAEYAVYRKMRETSPSPSKR